jgi:hypothetical protein
MGHSKSSITNSINNNTINSSDFENISKNIQESATNTLLENASSCSSSVEQNNTCNLANMQVGGNFTFSGTQSNKASVNFSCVQSSSAANSMTDAMTAAVSSEMGVLNGTEAAAKINAAAAAASKSGFLSTGGGSNSNASTNITNNVTNQTKAIVENIFKKNISNNFSSKTVDECIGRTTQTNNINLSGMKVGGNANVPCNQSNSVEQVSECKQLTEAINKSMSKAAQELGFKIEASSSTKTKNEVKATATSEAISTGPIQDLGNAVSGVIGSIGNVFGLASLGVAAPFIIYSCCICCCIILSLVSSAIAMKSGGGSSGVPVNFSMPRGMPRGMRKFRGGNSETDNSNDIIEYLGATSIDLISDVLTDKSPLFE